MYCVYKTTNMLNGMHYIGVHCHADNEKYLGSGRYLLAAVKEHGRQHFHREVLMTMETAEEAYAQERLLVTKEFIERPDTYNANLGGHRPPSRKGISHPHTLAERANISASHRRPWQGRKFSDAHRAKISAALTGFRRPPRSREYCAKISATLKREGIRPPNQLGKRWHLTQPRRGRSSQPARTD